MFNTSMVHAAVMEQSTDISMSVLSKCFTKGGLKEITGRCHMASRVNVFRNNYKVSLLQVVPRQTEITVCIHCKTNLAICTGLKGKSLHFQLQPSIFLLSQKRITIIHVWRYALQVICSTAYYKLINNHPVKTGNKVIQFFKINYLIQRTK